jgi:hypothetical protein
MTQNDQRYFQKTRNDEDQACFLVHEEEEEEEFTQNRTRARREDLHAMPLPRLHSCLEATSADYPPLELGVLAGSAKGWPERAGYSGPGRAPIESAGAGL